VTGALGCLLQKFAGNDHCPANVITRLGLFEMCRKELHKEFKETKLKSSVTNFVKMNICKKTHH
jgi:hypothetical protein